MAQLKTRKEANGTYSWKVIGDDGYGAKGPWERTEARTPWGARVQGAPYLKLELDAEELTREWEANPKPHTHTGRNADYASECESCNK
ncbi:hypothetical protein DN051_32315 [Streptomyces cadmiisoli]|uniref:Uncharacterized protein n=1 Tax=Streptomyces cadmiisoli TaxID=2184053 RepID=A0A2Z4J6P2_9ACTN|nr:hypothetical protein DN051_32315 [Streptomyces cadmiisoli]